MSNLIKSGRVVDIGVPVNVGISYSFNNVDSIIKENKVPVNNIEVPEKNTTALPKQIESIDISSKEEIMAQYIKEAKLRAENEYETAINRAYEEGISKAEEDAKKIIEKAQIDYQTILDDIVKLKEEAILEYKNEMKSIEKDVLKLALDIAEKVINYEVNKSDEYVLGIVKDALDRVINKKDVVVKLSTADYYTVLSNKKLLVARVKGFGEIEIVQDESMESGTCIVDTPLGVIDGSLQVRMDNIQKEITKILNE